MKADVAGARLRIREDGEERLVPLEEDLTTVGRATDATVRIGSALASRIHFQIERSGDRWKLVDLESQNGTVVNGQRVNQRALSSGDRIRIGETEIVFETTTARASEPRLAAARKGLRRISGGRGLRRRIALPPESPPAAEPVANADPDQLEGGLVAALEAIHRSYGEEGLAQAEKIFGGFVETRAKDSIRSLRDRAGRLEKLLEIGKALNSELNLRKLLNLIMDTVVALTHAERGFLILGEGGGMKIEIARNFDKEPVKNPTIKISRSIAEQVARTGEPVISSNAHDDPRFRDSMSVSDLRLRSLLCVPFKIREKVVGLVYIDNRFETGVFTEDDRRVLQGFCDQAAIAIENARLHEEALEKRRALEEEKEKVEQLNKRLSEKVEVQTVELLDTKKDLAESRRQLALKYNYDNIIGRSPKMQQVFLLLDRITDSEVPVLIQGESGTGKELVARAIHFNGPRKDRRFVSENCAAIPETLLESELFGHVRGSFTGAVVDKKGLFEVASCGTLFLDEIGDMPVEMQKKLLRALQEGEIRRVGGKDMIKVDVRIISASNKDLRQLLEEKRFREDLYYRLNVLTVNLPPLRDRREDIPLLVEHFLGVLAAETHTPPKRLDPRALNLVMNHSWPGNVRELENEVRRAVALSGDVIRPDELSPEARGESRRDAAQRYLERPLKDLVKEASDEVERSAILAVLQHTSWNKQSAAQILGISRPTLDAKMDALGLQR